MTECISNTGLFWLNMDKPTNQMITVATVEFEEHIDIKMLRLEVEKRFLAFKLFRKRAIPKSNKKFDYKWIFDPNFNIRYHVTRLALPEPRNKVALQEMINSLIVTPLDWSKPLWQFILIENYGKGCAVVFRMHHCMADKIDSMKILYSLVDNVKADISSKDSQSDIYSVTSLIPFGSVVRLSFDTFKNIKTIGKKIGESFLSSMSNPFYLIELVRTTTSVSIDIFNDLIKLLLIPPDSNTAFKGSPGVRKKLYWSEPVNYDEILIISNAFDVSINVVLIAVLTGALKRYLKKKKSAVDYRELRVVVPVDTRAQGNKYEFGKRYGVVPFDLPVHIDNPIKRLMEVKRRMFDLERAPELISCLRLLKAMGISSSKIAKKIAIPLTSKVTAVMTNAQGPKKTIYFAGKKVKNFMFWLPRPGNISIGTTIISYDKKVTLGIASDAELIPDGEIILETFQQEFETLLHVARSENIRMEMLVKHSKNQKNKRKKQEEKNDNPITIDSLADEMNSLG